MDPRTRRELTRYGAPAAFLAVVTIAVLLIKSALSGSSPSSPATVAVTPTTTRATTSVPRSTVNVTPATSAAQYYTVRPGDTLGSIAAKEGTTVEDLVRLNPGVDPRSLHSGQRVRVG